MLLYTGWAGTRPTSGASAAFTLAKSVAGLAGNYASVQDLPPEIPYLAVATGLGGLIGSELGSRRLRNEGIRRALAVVLGVAGLKLIFN